MSLVITAATPLAIVVGADSAVTSVFNEEEVVFTNFPKIVLGRHPAQAFAIMGDLKIGTQDSGSWAHIWLTKFLQDVAVSVNLRDTAHQLADALNDIDESGEANQIIIGAAWEIESQARQMIPVIWEISRGFVKEEFTPRELLSADETRDILHTSTEGDPFSRRFAFRLFHAGLPADSGKWIIHEGRESFGRLIGAEIPTPDVEGIEEYIRFLINLAADLYAVAGKPGYVRKPVHTAILFPEPNRPAIIRSTR